MVKNIEHPVSSEIYQPLQSIFKENNSGYKMSRMPLRQKQHPKISNGPGMWDTSYISKFMKSKAI